MSDGGAIPIEPTVANARPTAFDVIRQYRGLIGLDDPPSQLRQRAAERDLLGWTHASFEQVHRGVPVFGGMVKTHQNARGEFVAVNGPVFPVPTKLSVTPTLDQAAAERVAVAAMRSDTARPDATELVIVDPGWYGDRPQGPHLAYFIRLVDGASAEAFFIDAHTGRVLDQWNLTETLRDRVIHDAGGGPELPGTVARTEGQGPTGNGEVDRAYDYAGDAYDYLFRGFGRDSFDGLGSTIVATVNSGALSCPNARWNGSQAIFCPGLTLDDVVVHELTHGLIQHTADLIYQNQPGQLNESYADVFGELADLFNGNTGFAGPPAGPFWPPETSGPGTDTPNLLRTNACVGGYSLNVLEPASIAGTYLATRAVSGAQLDQTGRTGRVVMAVPALACPRGALLSNAAEIAGNFALVDRGNCNLVDKALNAQNAGATGMIVVNNRAGFPPTMTGVDSLIVVPFVAITQDDGALLKARLAAGDVVRVTMRANDVSGGVRWLLGETTPEAAGRDMYHPSCKGSPDSANHPYQLCSVTDNGGVHSGSGVPNHAFALATDGGEFNGFTIDGIGPIKSGAVWYRALTSYLTVASDFQDAYAALNQAALDLVGTFPLDPRTGFPSAEVFTALDAEQLDLALQAVEMNAPGACGANTPILDPNPPPICAAHRVVFEDDFENGIDGWTVSNSAPPTPYDWTQTTELPDRATGTAWFIEDRNIGDCTPPSEAGIHSLLSPTIVVPADAATVQASFTHWVVTEPTFDGGNVSLSVNGAAFVLLPSAAFVFNPYNATLNPQSANPLGGQPAFSGYGGSWGTSVVDLTGLAGPNDSVQFRFDFAKDACVGLIGWYLTDFRLLACSDGGTGDFDGDGRIDLSDHACFQRCFGESITSTPSCAPADANGDGVVGLADHLHFVAAMQGP